MEERFINLDNSPRPELRLQVAGKLFHVRRVVTGVRQLWAAFVQETVELLELVGAWDAAQKKSREHDGGDHQAKLAGELEEITRKVDAFYEGKTRRLLEIIELLLVKNGESFERQWWISNADEEDYKEFIIACLTRDESASGSKKKTQGEGS